MKTLTLGFVVICLTLTPALAEDAPQQKRETIWAHSWEISPAIAYSWYDTKFVDQEGWALRVGYAWGNRWSTEIDVMTIETEAKGRRNIDADIDTFRWNVLLNFDTDDKQWVPFLSFGVGYLGIDTDTSRVDQADDGGLLALGGGFRYYFNDHVGVRLDGTWESSGDLSPFSTTVGLTFNFGGKERPDSDGDGIYDKYDQCPDTPRGCHINGVGCPSDGDGDGVCDGVDQCPDTPKGCTVDAKGCPSDGDGDGVCDGVDQCPDTPQGCAVDARGCPSDGDGDGVCNGVDQCPDTPKGAAVDAKGCHTDPIIKKLEAGETLILEGVTFDSNEHEITPEAGTTLDKVAKSLAIFTTVHVRIEGHTDSRHTEAHNQKLSERRAEAVKAYLVGKGIAAERLTAVGHGEAQPVADNDTEEGRAQNRRVELKKAS